MKRIIGIAGVGLIAIALIAGCGSSSDDGLSKSEFVTKANAICKKGNADVEAAANEQFGKSGDKQPSQEELTAFATETVIPNVQSQVDQIKALDEPSADADQVNAITDSAQADIDKMKADPSLVTDENSDPFAATDKLAKAYGLNVCASDN